MRFDDNFVDQVRNSAHILDIIGDYVQLRKSGQNYVALCPFHNEKTPSFNVSPSKQIFKCFGCGIGGDVFGFIMEIEKMSFPESIRHLAERCAIPIPKADARPSQEQIKNKRLREAMAAADEIFQANLQNSPTGDAARAYLDKRQIDTATQGHFGLGFAPGENQLSRALQKRGYTPDELETCGLVKQSNDGRIYDQFRHRITFPIREPMGHTIAFGGRVIAEGGPKYLNSPETVLYSKGDHLYGLASTRDEIRKRDFAILVEGYFDCIVPFQFGFPNAVASLGTALTAGQVKLLGRYTRNVIINYDPDAAGMSAALRSVDLFLELGFSVNVLQLPGGDDPDSYLLRHGSESYRRQLRNSVRFLDFVVAQAMSEHSDPSTARAKRAVVDTVLPYLNKIPDRIERAEYRSRIAARIQVDESLLQAEQRRMVRPSARRDRSFKPDPLATPTRAERTLLTLALGDEPHWLLKQLEPELFKGLRTDKIFGEILSQWKQNGSVNVLRIREALDSQDRDLIERVSVKSSEPVDDKETVENSLAALRLMQLNRKSRQIQAEIETLRRSEQTPAVTKRLDELLVEKERLRRQGADKEG